MRSRTRYTLAPLFLLVIAACGTSDDAGSPDVTEAEIEVEVDIFSGRENPRWTLDGSDVATLIDLISAMSERGAADMSDDVGLGFRGFVLRGSALPGQADQIRVLGSELVSSRGDAAGVLRIDEGREVYTMLRAMSEEHLDENVMQAIPVDGLKGSQ